jgi:hypothetical protein
MVAIASAAPLIHSIWLSAEIWWVLRAASGLCLATLYMIIESWLNEKATNQNRGTVLRHSQGQVTTAERSIFNLLNQW